MLHGTMSLNIRNLRSVIHVHVVLAFTLRFLNPIVVSFHSGTKSLCYVKVLAVSSRFLNLLVVIISSASNQFSGWFSLDHSLTASAYQLVNNVQVFESVFTNITPMLAGLITHCCTVGMRTRSETCWIHNPHKVCWTVFGWLHSYFIPEYTP